MDSDDAFSVHSTRTRPRLGIIDRSIAYREASSYILYYTGMEQLVHYVKRPPSGIDCGVNADILLQVFYFK